MRIDRRSETFGTDAIKRCLTLCISWQVLLFERLREEHSGRYTCVASNAASSSNSTAELKVKVKNILLNVGLLQAIEAPAREGEREAVWLRWCFYSKHFFSQVVNLFVSLCKPL